MLLQSVYCLDALVFPVGLSCLGPVFPLFVVDSSFPGPSPLLRSRARSGSPLSTPDLLHIGSSVPLRCKATAGLTLFASGLSCFGSVSSPPVASSATLGPALMIRSPARVSPVPFVLDSLDSGSSSVSKSYVGLGLSLFPFGKSLLEVPALVSDFASSDSSSFLHSVFRPGLVLLVLDSLHLGSFTPSRCSSCFESLALAFGLSRLGSVSFLSVVASTNLESSSTARTYACLGLPPSALDFLSLGFFMFPRQLCRLGLACLLFRLGLAGIRVLAVGRELLPSRSIDVSQILSAIGAASPSSEIWSYWLGPFFEGYATLGLNFIHLRSHEAWHATVGTRPYTSGVCAAGTQLCKDRLLAFLVGLLDLGLFDIVAILGLGGPYSSSVWPG